MPKMKYVNLAVVAVVLVLAIGLGLLYAHKSKNKQPVIPVIKQTYSQATEYAVTGLTAGTGAIFNKPAEFGNTKSSKLTANFEETTSNSQGQTVPLAEMAAIATPLHAPYSATSLASLNKAILASSSTNQTLLLPVQNFVSRNLDKGYTVKFGTIKQFSSSNIKANAWVVGETATPTNAKDQDALPNQQGQVVYAIGQTGYYYLMIMALNDRWTANQSSWQTVFGSLKVDQ